MKYDLEALKGLNIGEVIVALGGEEVKAGRMFRCFNKAFHQHADKSPSMSVKKGTNSCKCFACGVGGDPISIATTALGDFKSACEWLSSTFGIAYLDSIELPKSTVRLPKTEAKKIEYLTFNKAKKFGRFKVFHWLDKYSEMTDSQKLKMVYSYLYRFSLKTEQTAKLGYYEGRGIKQHVLLDKIGYLSESDLKELLAQLENHFPIEDLIKFKLFNDVDAKAPLQWKYGSGALLVIPSFDLYSDLVTGLMLRPIHKEKWMPKEFQVTHHDIVDGFPFAMNYEMFAGDSCNETIYFTEGHIDGLSLLDKCFVAIPGVHSYKVEWLGLFRGKKCVIAFDADKAGIEGAEKLKQELLKAGVEQVEILTWDPVLGKDLNERLLNKNL